MPNPSSLIRRQTEAVGAQFDSKKAEISGQIEQSVSAQVNQIKDNEKKQMSAIDLKIDELSAVLSQMGEMDPRSAELKKHLGMLKGQKNQIKAQVKMAISAVKANAARERENIKTRLEKEKQKAVRSAVEATLAQFTMLMQKKQAQGAVSDELKSGNRG